VLCIEDAGQKPGGKAEALTPQEARAVIEKQEARALIEKQEARALIEKQG
jgi:hypothetical protein